MIYCALCKVALCEDSFVNELEAKDLTTEYKYFCSVVCQNEYIKRGVKISFALITKKDITLEDKIKSLELENIKLKDDYRDYKKHVIEYLHYLNGIIKQNCIRDNTGKCMVSNCNCEIYANKNICSWTCYCDALHAKDCVCPCFSKPLSESLGVEPFICTEVVDSISSSSEEDFN